MHKFEYAQKTNATLIDFIKFGDAKAGSIFTLSTVGIGALTTKAGSTTLDAFALNPFFGVLAFTFLLSNILVLGRIASACVQALTPRLPSTKSSTCLNSLADIQALPFDEYLSRAKKLSEVELSDHLFAHNWTLSVIGWNKFSDIGLALIRAKQLLWTGSLYLGYALFIQVLTSVRH